MNNTYVSSQRDACRLAWQLLTEVYRLPPEKLYVTFFGGNVQLGLPPDTETRDIWIDIGLVTTQNLFFNGTLFLLPELFYQPFPESLIVGLLAFPTKVYRLRRGRCMARLLEHYPEYIACDVTPCILSLLCWCFIECYQSHVPFFVMASQTPRVCALFWRKFAP